MYWKNADQQFLKPLHFITCTGWLMIDIDPFQVSVWSLHNWVEQPPFWNNQLHVSGGIIGDLCSFAAGDELYAPLVAWVHKKNIQQSNLPGIPEGFHGIPWVVGDQATMNSIVDLNLLFCRLMASQAVLMLPYSCICLLKLVEGSEKSGQCIRHSNRPCSQRWQTNGRRCLSWHHEASGRFMELCAYSISGHFFLQDGRWSCVHH